MNSKFQIIFCHSATKRRRIKRKECHRVRKREIWGFLWVRGRESFKWHIWEWICVSVCVCVCVSDEKKSWSFSYRNERMNESTQKDKQGPVFVFEEDEMNLMKQFSVVKRACCLPVRVCACVCVLPPTAGAIVAPRQVRLRRRIWNRQRETLGHKLFLEGPSPENSINSINLSLFPPSNGNWNGAFSFTFMSKNKKIKLLK